VTYLPTEECHSVLGPKGGAIIHKDDDVLMEKCASKTGDKGMAKQREVDPSIDICHCFHPIHGSSTDYPSIHMGNALIQPDSLIECNEDPYNLRFHIR
jgi:hypothetical protein